MMQATGRVIASSASRGALRGLATQSPLQQELAGVPATEGISKEAPGAQVTTLSNGLRVASEENYSQVSSVGIIFEAGSRSETSSNNGISHLLDHMAFKTTTNRSHLRIVRDTENMGAHAQAFCLREHSMYTVDVLRHSVEGAVELLADTIQRPAFKSHEVNEQKQYMQFELQEFESNPAALLQEAIHAAAYIDNTPLGQPLYCPRGNLDALNPDTLRAFCDEHFTANRMVLSAAGVDHSTLVGFAEEYFGDLPSGTPSTPASSPYVGSEVRVKSDDAGFTHVAIAFDAGGWKDQQLLPLCVLHQLLGGGGSFSAGGPGKGMYSQLYRNVLNKHHWVDSATAFNSMFVDAGIMGIQGTACAADVPQLVDVLCDSLNNVATKALTDEEVTRARNQLKSSLLMNLETRGILMEDIGRQILTYGERETPASLCERIDAVSAQDVQAAAKRLVSSNLSVASVGDLSSMPSHHEISKKF